MPCRGDALSADVRKREGLMGYIADILNGGSMENSPVIWAFGNRGDRCHGLIEDALAGEFGATGLTFTHYLDLSSAGLPAARGAIVVVSGGVQRDYHKEITAALDRLDWALVLLSADEQTEYPWETLKGPRRKVWIQMPCGAKTAGCDRVFPIGYPRGTRQILASLPKPQAQRRYPWSFVGQMQNEQRRDCIVTLDARKDGGLVRRTAGFAQGYDKAEYLKILLDSYLAPGPAGMYTADCFRFWEALECGCLPVCDRRKNGANPPSYNYWNDLLGGGPPFPTLDRWSEFNAIADRYAADPKLRQADTDKAAAWWTDYKVEFAKNLVADTISLAIPGGTG